MKGKFLPVLVLLCAAAPAGARPAAGASPADWKPLERILGQSGLERGNGWEAAFPRTDLNVVVQGVPLDAAMGLTSRAFFQPQAHGTVLAAELVLLDQEVPKVLAQAAREGGLEVSCLQHPFLYESPTLEVLRLTGWGPRDRLARALRSVLAVTGTPLGPSGIPMPSPAVAAMPGATPGAGTPAPGKDWSRVESILGPGRLQGRVWAYDVPASFSLAEAWPGSFFRLEKSGARMAAAGELVLPADRVNPVIEALTRHHLAVTAVDSAFAGPFAGVFFLRFWGLGDAAETAQGLKAALSAARPR